MNVFSDLSTAMPARPRRAAGFRVESPETAHWRAAADGYQGLPEGLSHPHQILDALRQARAKYRLSDADLTLLADLYAATQPRDWQTRPMAWPSNETLASRMGRSVSAVQRMIGRLARAGFLVMRDSPTGKRYGMRDTEGRITKAYGFDLSPLALRYQEFRAAAAERNAADALIRALRSRAVTAKRTLLALIDAAEEAGLWTPFWEDAATETRQLTANLSRTRATDRLSAIATRLTTLTVEAQALLKAAAEISHADEGCVETNAAEMIAEVENMRCADSARATLKNTTNSSHKDICNKGRQVCKSRPDVPALPEFASQEARRSVSDRGDPLDHIDIGSLVSAAPELARARAEAMAETGEAPPATWAGLKHLAFPLLARYDIARRFWEDAADRVGERMALVIFALMLARGRDHYQSPGGAFRRMVEKAENGALNILPSYYGLTRGPAATATSEMSDRQGTPQMGPEAAGAPYLGAILGRRLRSARDDGGQ